MRKIDMQTWPRRPHFELYRHFDHPLFSLCANVELGATFAAVKERGFSISTAIIYLIARVANEIPEFRYRMRGDEVVEHTVVDPSPTVMTPGDLFSFCTIQYSQDFAEFAARAAERMAAVRQQIVLADEPGRDDLLFMTAIPWVSFTSFTHPTHLNPADSVPALRLGQVLCKWRGYDDAVGRASAPRPDGRGARGQVLHADTGVPERAWVSS